MKIQPILEPHNERWQHRNISFGIFKGYKKRPYGDYIWGEYKGKKIEVFDAYKNNQLLIYVSENMNFIKSKLVYFKDNKKDKVVYSENKRKEWWA